MEMQLSVQTGSKTDFDVLVLNQDSIQVPAAFLGDLADIKWSAVFLSSALKEILKCGSKFGTEILTY
jgi:hypothetical protein